MNDLQPHSGQYRNLKTHFFSRLGLLLVPVILLSIFVTITQLTPVAQAANVIPPQENAQPVKALTGTDIDFEQQTPWITRDRNKECAVDGGGNPTESGWFLLDFITNTTGSAINGIEVTLDGFYTSTGAIRVFNGLGESGYRYVGALAAGEGTPIYWWVKVEGCAGTLGVNALLGYTYTLGIKDSSGTTISKTAYFQVIPVVTAAVGGTTFSLVGGPGTYIGQILPVTITYDFGNMFATTDAGVSFAANGTTESGWGTVFDATCFQLVHAKTGDSTGFTTVPTIDELDRVYWPVSGSGSSAQLTMTYYVKVLCTPATQTGVGPSFAAKSGSTQYKAILPSAFIAFPPITPTLSISVSKSVVVDGCAKAQSPDPHFTATWTINFYNSGRNQNTAVPVYLSNITDTIALLSGSNLPVFQGETGASGVTRANSYLSPTISNQYGTMLWKTGLPASAYLVPGNNGSNNGTLTLIYTTTTTEIGAIYKNTVVGQVGLTTAAVSGTNPAFPGPGTTAGNIATAGCLTTTDVTLSTFDAHTTPTLPWLPIALGALGVLILGGVALTLGKR